MKRRIFNLLAAVSLVLCVAVVAVWVRSYRRFDQVQFNWIRPNGAQVSYTEFQFGAALGQLFVGMHHGRLIEPDASAMARSIRVTWGHDGRVRYASQVRPSGRATEAYDLPWWARDAADQSKGFLRFGLASQNGYIGRMSPENRYYAAAFPAWAVVIPLAVVPLDVCRRRLRRSLRRRRGLCTECGYDLRASKERCPECGAAIAETRIAE